MKDLIERLEAATGPDRRLDAEIACAVIFPDLRPAEPDDHKEYLNGIPPSAGNIWCPTGFLMARSYTSSIDDAQELVPKGMVWTRDAYGDFTVIEWRGSSNMQIAINIAKGRTLAIAALRARCLMPELIR